jgi:hypothetical protein
LRTGAVKGRQVYRRKRACSSYPHRAWKNLIADPAWKKDPDAHLLRVLEKSNPLAMKNLAAGAN